MKISFKNHLVPLVSPPPHICLQRRTWLREKFIPGRLQEELLGEAPADTARWIQGPHKDQLRCSWGHSGPSLSQKQNCLCTAQSFQEATVAFRGGGDLSSHHFTEQSSSGGSLCCTVPGGGRDMQQMQSHQITKTSAVFLLLPTITIGTTSCCYHGNRTVPSAQLAMMQRPLKNACCKALGLTGSCDPQSQGT